MNLLIFLASGAAILAVPTSMPGVSSALNDYNLSFDAEEQVMVFARSEADFQGATIFTAQRTGRKWSKAVPIDFTNKLYNDSDPWLSPDGRTLYFISDRPAVGREQGRKDYDIWRARRTRTGWSEPEHLGPEVNGRGQELGPELHAGTLYFSSARRSGVGALDIYSAKAAGPAFAPATPLPGPFNSAGSDSDFTLSADGAAAMFWRSQGDGGLIHIAHRQADGWSKPEPLGPQINIGPFNFSPSFSRDGRRIRYASTRERPGQPAGHADIYEAKLPPR